ncbi:MAG: hypothetical protein OXH68_17845 [Gammaproteobacteria bacterium]|nr:hypothetical protein [Gammaproteobacteria bacterium]
MGRNNQRRFALLEAGFDGIEDDLPIRLPHAAGDEACFSPYRPAAAIGLAAARSIEPL